MKTDDLITIDPDILGGTPVFKGTRVPIKTLFEYLENNYSLEQFLECFPSVTRDSARQVLECSEQALLHSAAASPADLPLKDEERALLDARLADMELNPHDQSSWSDVKKRLEKLT